MLKLYLIVMLWVLVAAAFIADTLYWYSIVVGVVGGVRSLAIHGCTCLPSNPSLNPTVTPTLTRP